MGGFPAVPPTPYKNPVLDELDRLSPQAKDALSRAHQSIASIQAPPEVSPNPMQPAQIPGSAPRIASPPSYTPKPLGGATAPAAGTPPPMTPDQQGHLDERNRLISSGSGISQVHNPFLKTIGTIGDVLGSTFAPRAAAYIPGTTLHHEMLLGNAQKAVNSDEAQREAEGKLGQEAAQTAHTQAEIPLTEAQTSEANARIPLVNAQAQSAQESADALPETQATEKELKTAQAKEAEARAEAALHPTEKTAFDLWKKQNPNGTAEDWLKLEAANKPAAQGNDFEQYYKDYLKDNNFPDTAHNRQLARKEWAAASQAPQRAPQVTVVVPDGQGGGTVQTVHAGEHLVPGTTTTAGFNQEAVAGNKQDVAAKKAQADAQKEYALAENLAAHPSPTNDLALVMRYIGSTKPDSLGKLRLNQNEMDLVLGTRSTFGNLEALANKVKNGQMLTATQRKDMLNTMKMLTGANEQPQVGGSAGNSSEPTLDEINAEVERRKKSK